MRSFRDLKGDRGEQKVSEKSRSERGPISCACLASSMGARKFATGDGDGEWIHPLHDVTQAVLHSRGLISCGQL
jgi:hypothetical protein